MVITNSDTLLRHRTIDKCLRNSFKKYSLNDLVFACSSELSNISLYKKGKTKLVSKRTIQLDLHFMRDKDNGYGAPIIVYENKYYKYSNPSFSIEKAIVKEDNYVLIGELLKNLKEFSRFKELSTLRNAINILDEEVSALFNRRESVISYEGKDKPLGLELFDNFCDAILNKKVLYIGYYSSRSENIISIVFYPFYLKEYRGRWFALGYKDGLNSVYKLPLDRIRDFSYSILPFPQELHFNPADYFTNIIGVTKLSGEVREIELLVKNKIAPFVKLNPIHHSQRIVRVEENGDIVFSIRIIPNSEFYNYIFINQPNINILSPRDIGVESNKRITEVLQILPSYINHNNPEQLYEEFSEGDDGQMNLFGNL